MSIAIVINPISGGGRGDAARRRAELAAEIAAAHHVPAEILVTERTGHATDLAAAALARGVTAVVAWGGDGTVNEVARALAHRDVALAIVPSGSGNGLARELGIPFDPAAALATALNGQSRRIDCGELDGRIFVNVAGLGLDAIVAHEFATHGRRRGLLRYLEITARELLRYVPDEHTIDVDGRPISCRALIIAIANARQYGNGALIAPQALVDDGRLDVVVVAHRPVWRTVVRVPQLFTGSIARVPGVSTMPGARITIASTRPAVYHVDGEPFVGGTSLEARVLPSALLVRVPTR